MTNINLITTILFKLKYKHKKYNVLFLLVISLVVLITIYLLFIKKDNTEQLNNTTIQVIKKTLDKRIQVTGTLEAVNQVDIGAQVSGQIKHLYVHDGDIVKRGDIVAQVNPEIAEAELKSAKAAYQSAELRLKGKLMTAGIQQTELQRLQRLFASDAVPENDIRKAKEQIDNLNIDIEVTKKEVNLQASQVRKAQQKLKLTTIRSPINGIVVGTVVKAGQTLTASQVTPVLMKVVNLDVMEIKLNLSEVDIVKVKQNMTIWYRPLHSATEKIKGRIYRVIPVPNDMNQSQGQKFYTAIIKILSPPKFARIGMTVAVEIILKQPKEILLLHRNAVLTPIENGDYQVTVQQKQKQKQYIVKKITLEDSFYPYYEVKAGLKEGDKVLAKTDQQYDH